MLIERKTYSEAYQDGNSFEIQGVTPKLRLAEITNDLLLKTFVSKINVSNSDNLDIAFSWRDEGMAIEFIGNHLSNFDAPVLWRTLRNLGFCGLKDAPVFAVGKRLLDNPRTRLFTRFIDGVPVWPPTVKPKSRKEREESFELNSRAFRTAKEVLKQGRSFVVFAEGTRSREEVLHQGKATAARYFSLMSEDSVEPGMQPAQDTLIVPFALSGTEVLYPGGQSIPYRRGEVGLAFMEPILASELESLYADVNNKNERQQLMIDHVMMEVACGLPYEKRGYYADKI